MMDQSQNVGHAGRVSSLALGMAKLLGLMTVISLLLGLTIGGVMWLLMLGCIAGWLTLGGYVVLHLTVINPVGDAIGRVIVPSGSSIPSVAQHSNIEAMEMQGRFAEAADAYQAIIASSPGDLVPCEKLGVLALRQLKDYELAVFAYHEAEKRVTEPRRKLGFAMIVAGIYRDNLKDYGKGMVELRRIVATYPDAPNRARLSAEIDEPKTLHFGGQ